MHDTSSGSSSASDTDRTSIQMQRCHLCVPQLQMVHRSPADKCIVIQSQPLCTSHRHGTARCILSIFPHATRNKILLIQLVFNRSGISGIVRRPIVEQSQVTVRYPTCIVLIKEGSPPAGWNVNMFCFPPNRQIISPVSRSILVTSSR